MSSRKPYVRPKYWNEPEMGWWERLYIFEVMRGLAITQENLTNQQGVVSNEVKVNVLNQPYGGFPWLDMPQLANTNWYNAHNFYGELSDLEAATLEDVQAFFDMFYAPDNAALVVVGTVAGCALGYEIIGELAVFRIFDKAKVKHDDQALKKSEELGADLAQSLAT